MRRYGETGSSTTTTRRSDETGSGGAGPGRYGKTGSRSASTTPQVHQRVAARGVVIGAPGDGVAERRDRRRCGDGRDGLLGARGVPGAQ